MIVKCYEVYEYNSPRTVAFLTKELAENQEIFQSVDFIEKVTLDLCYEEIKQLNKGMPIFDLENKMKYTLTIRGLSFEEAKEIANSDCELMWSNENGIATAYPTTDEYPTTIELSGCE